MRVLRVIPTMDPSSGGPCQGIRNLIPALQALGVEDEVVSLDEPGEFKDSFPIHRIGRGRGPWSYSAQLRPWLERNLDRFDAVIVHALWLFHSSAVTKSIVGRRRQSKHAPKLLVMPHGMLDPWFQRHPSRRIKAIRNWLYWKLVEKQVVADADALLFTCQRELELAREPFRPYLPKCELNVGYGVSMPPNNSPGMQLRFEQRCPELKGRPYWLYLSRVHPKKGVDHLIHAYATLAKTRPAELPALVIAGPLDSEFATRMQALATSLGLTQQSGEGSNRAAEILFPGMLQGEPKWGAFYGCEAFVLPSHQENFGIAVVEALACGKPVLISDQINIFKEIEQAGAALVEPDTAEGTRRLLERWLERTPGHRQTMAQAARTCYETHFRPEAAARRLVDTISGLS